MRNKDAALAVEETGASVNTTAPAPVETRQIPNPPGGGSWTWDEAKLAWISNDPVVKPVEQTQE